MKTIVLIFLAIILKKRKIVGFLIHCQRKVASVRQMSTPEWDSIMPEAERQAKRAKEVRDRIAQLREYKKQGRSYDGERVEEAKKKKIVNESELGR